VRWRAYYLIAKGDALPVVLAEPLSRGILIGEDLQVILVVDLLAGIDINPDGHALSLICRNISRTSMTRSGFSRGRTPVMPE
jgi:hypothetical protein